MPCYIGVYQCILCLCVWTGGLCSPGCGRGVCSGGSWWRFKLLGVVCVCDQPMQRLDHKHTQPPTP